MAKSMDRGNTGDRQAETLHSGEESQSRQEGGQDYAPDPAALSGAVFRTPDGGAFSLPGFSTPDFAIGSPSDGKRTP